jgi:hypothetical protein
LDESQRETDLICRLTQHRRRQRGLGDWSLLRVEPRCILLHAAECKGDLGRWAAGKVLVVVVVMRRLGIEQMADANPWGPEEAHADQKIEHRSQHVAARMATGLKMRLPKASTAVNVRSGSTESACIPRVTL